MAGPIPVFSISLPDGSQIAPESMGAVVQFRDGALQFWSELLTIIEN